MANVVDIDEIVEKWAWNAFTKTRSPQHKDLKLDDVRLDIKWDRVKFSPSPPKYIKWEEQKLPKSQVVFKSVFENQTGRDQQHSFKTERSTVASASTTITKGYTMGMSLGLNLSLPGDVVEATAAFGRETRVDKTENSSEEKSLTWSVDHNILVPAKKKVIADLLVKEEQYSCSFETYVKMRGKVRVNITSPKDNNNFIMSVEAEIAEIFRNDRTAMDSTATDVVIEGRTVTWHVSGKCQFQYGVEQQTHLQEEDFKLPTAKK